MNLRARFSIIGLCILIFLIVTPILVLFATGFKIDFKNGRIVKTGLLVVATQPEKAQILLDDELVDATPATIRFLLPGDYNVRIEKEGYMPWAKRLTIRSQLATWANSNREFIALFLAEPRLEQEQVDAKKLKEPKTLQGGNFTFQLEKIYQPATNGYWDEDARRLVISNSNEILLFDPLSDSLDLILRSVSEIKNASLNWHTGYVFFENEGKIKAIELDGRDQRNVYTFVAAGEDFVVDKKGERLYVINGDEVKQYRIR